MVSKNIRILGIELMTFRMLILNCRDLKFKMMLTFRIRLFLGFCKHFFEMFSFFSRKKIVLMIFVEAYFDYEPYFHLNKNLKYGQ